MSFDLVVPAKCPDCGEEIEMPATVSLMYGVIINPHFTALNIKAHREAAGHPPLAKFAYVDDVGEPR